MLISTHTFLGFCPTSARLCISLLLLASVQGCTSTRSGVNVGKVMTDPQPIPANAISFRAACEHQLSEARTILAQLTDKASAKDAKSVLSAANDIAVLLDRSASLSSLYQSVHPDKAMREAAEHCEQEVSKFATELGLHRGYYDAVASIPAGNLQPEDKRWIDKTLRDLRRSGVDKDEATRNEIKRLNEELVKISQEFSKNMREDVRRVELTPAELEGLPADYLTAHPAKNGVITITTDYPDYVPVMTYAHSGQAREKLYRAFRLRGHPQNLSVLDRMVKARAQLAQVLGYKTYADYVTETRMIGSGKKAGEFIEEIAAIAEPRAKADYAELLARKRKDDPTATAVHEWDRGYYEEKVRADNFAFSAQSVRPYFEYSRVKEGVMRTNEKLFGVTFNKLANNAWHDEVETYDVLRAGKVIGRFMLDMHPRNDKYKHAAQFTYQSGVKDRQIPIGVLVCNFPNPKQVPAGQAALMEHKDVVTFFHEFGHLLHHIFGGEQKWLAFSGVATEWDFVEAPSQMLEEWAWDHKVLASFAKHYQSNETIPEALVKKMRTADEFGKGIQARVQMFYAALSLQLFSRSPAGLDSTALVSELQGKYSPFAYVPGTYFHLSFGHLDGYSAGYYTYMWSLVIAKDLFSRFAQQGMMNTDVATAYRDRVLAPGGSDDAAELVKGFLGRPYSFDSFKTWLQR